MSPADTATPLNEPDPSTAEAAAPLGTTDPLSPEQRLAELEARHAELEAKHTEVADAYLRAKAETENIRRRSDEEVSKARKFSIENFAESLLPVKDSLEAALAIQGASIEQVHEGVHATLRQLKAALERNKVLEISPAAGTRFDPHHHQAISLVPAPGQEPNTVVAVLQKGYSISDRVLRPALVTVSTAG